MMNTNTKSGKKMNRQGAALMIALITAVVVMLAATLLISLTERMVNSHSERLFNAQIALSETSAADGLAYLIETAGTGAASTGSSFTLAGVRTEFTLTETGTAGIRNGFYQLRNPEGTVIIPTGVNLVSAASNGETVTISFYSDETFRSTLEFTISTAMRPVAGTGITVNGENGAVVVLQGFGETMLCAVTENGIVAGSTIDFVSITENSHLSASCSAFGEPMIVISSGSGSGSLHNISSGESIHVSSPPGTCPVFMPDGTLFGSLSGSPSFSIARVRDVFSGDFNNDGSDDMAFATSFSLSVYSGANRELYTAGPGGSLVCWGDVSGRNGLSGMWAMPSGEETWFRLGYDGFSEFMPEMIYRMGWEGRFTGYGNTFAGFIQGAAVVASTSGYLQEFLSGDVFTGNADGGPLDFFILREDGLEAVFNPVSGDGIRLVFDSRNTFQGVEMPGNTHVFSVFETENRRRVFHTLGENSL